jgi:hypothetical protein
MNAIPLQAGKERELWRPSPEEIQAACETLMRLEPMNSEALRVVADRLASDWRDHATGCLKRARQYSRWASEYPVGSPRYEHYRGLAREQRDKAKWAVRKYRQNKEH